MNFIDPQRRFRAEIYMDIWVDDTGDYEQTRKSAKKFAQETIESLPNAYLANVDAVKATDFDKPM